MTEPLDQRERSGQTPARATRPWLWIAIAAVAAVAAFVLFWFQPQKLFIDDRVDEAIPTATTQPPATTEATTAPDSGTGSTTSTTSVEAEPVELARGDFVSRDHGTTGVARVLELPDGRRILRLEALDTDNGPDLYVYLAANPASGEEAAFDDGHLSLGRLKGNQGDQNYDIPPDADLTSFASVVIWCDRFDSAFGAADLMGA